MKTLKSHKSTKVIATLAFMTYLLSYSTLSIACTPLRRNNPQYIIQNNGVQFTSDSPFADEPLIATNLKAKNLRILISKSHMANGFASDGHVAYVNALKLKGDFDAATLTPVEVNGDGNIVYWMIFEDKSNLYRIQSQDKQSMTLVAFSPKIAPENRQIRLSDNQTIHLTDKKNDIRYSVQTSNLAFARWPGKASDWERQQIALHAYSDGVYLYGERQGLRQSTPWHEAAGLYILGQIEQVKILGSFASSVSHCGLAGTKHLTHIYARNGQLFWGENPDPIGKASDIETENQQTILAYIKTKERLLPLPSKQEPNLYHPSNPMHNLIASLTVSGKTTRLITEYEFQILQIKQ